VCAQCHTLFGEGGRIGPELTGGNRADLDYLLSNVLDPSAVLAKEYMPVVAELKSGRVVTGLLRAEDPASITLATTTETLVIAKDDIEERSTSNVSMMPDDLLKNLSDDDVRSLAGYLASPRQTPLRADAMNAAGFFNGNDLANWTGTEGLWRVEAGEIVGETKGLARNEFLVSSYEVGDFRLSLEVKLEPNSANSGIQFRSVSRGEGDVAGYQADIGEGWWGKLYEEHGRGLLWDKPGDSAVNAGDWNQYEIVAVGRRIQTFINGTPCVDLTDPQGALRGVIALQLHSGGATHVRFRNLKLEVLPAAVAPTQ
jgi:putative heme-binding domain-containing protein